jgi:hypothetical protein
MGGTEVTSLARAPVENPALAWSGIPSATVSVQNQAAQTVASRRLPFTTSGARYRIRLPTGTYSINAVTAWGGSAGDTVYVPADQTNEEDFEDSSLSCVG